MRTLGTRTFGEWALETRFVDYRVREYVVEDGAAEFEGEAEEREDLFCGRSIQVLHLPILI
jgi:hypothetical protein